MKAYVNFAMVGNLWLCLGWGIIWPWESIANVDSCSLLASRTSRVAKLTYSPCVELLMTGWLKLLPNINDWDLAPMSGPYVIFADSCWDEATIWLSFGGCATCSAVVLLRSRSGLCCLRLPRWLLVADKFVFFALGILLGIIRNN